MTFRPTPEQEAIVAAAQRESASLMVTAYAGCAKTTTLELIAQALPPKPALALAFNVKIKKELERRFPDHFHIKTLNGLGHGAWAKAINKMPSVDEKKLGRLTTTVVKDSGASLTTDEWHAIRQLVAKAMQAGLVPSDYPHVKGFVPDTDQAWESIADEAMIDFSGEILILARRVLAESIKESFSGVLSYDDQIYMSAMFHGVFPRYPLVMVDEAQDLSPLNHRQVARCAADRLIVVGDAKQAIYAFRGADSESIAKLRSLRKEWIDLPLATTFRCPQRIVERQQHHALGFKAFEKNPQGEVRDFSFENPKWSWEDVEEAHSHGSIAILCRNNAPLLAMAFKLIRQRIGCFMLGRDLGKGLVSLSKKILPDDNEPLEGCVKLVNYWMDRERRLALANNKEEKLDQITDRGECLLAVLESGGVTDAKSLRKELTALFSRDSGVVTLATGHRAKGLEWETVIHLDPWRLPSKWAKAALAEGNPVPMQQERNLLYVIETRAKHTLVLASLEFFE